MSLSHSIYFRVSAVHQIVLAFKASDELVQLTQYHTSHATILEKFSYLYFFALNKSFFQEFFLCLMSAYPNPANPTTHRPNPFMGLTLTTSS